MVSGVFLLVFIGQIFDIEFAESVVRSILNYVIPAEISLTTDYIVNFTKDILQRQSYLYIASGIALLNMFFLLIAIKDHFDEILDHYYTKSAGMFLWHQFLKIFFSICFLGMFHFILQPIISQASQITFGAMILKYGLLFIFLFVLFHHSSNSTKLPYIIMIKGALLSTVLLWILDYLIFDLLAQKHSFFGSENHGSSIGVIFLFPFWIYLAWNIVFLGLEYIASYTKSVSKKYTFAYLQYVKLSILEALYNEKTLTSDAIVKRFGIDFRYFQTKILFRLTNDRFVTYHRKRDQIIGKDGWYEKSIFDYFNFDQLIISQDKANYISFLQRLDSNARKKLTFEDYFGQNAATNQEEQQTLWTKFKGIFS